MPREATIPCVAEAMAERVAERLRVLLADQPSGLEDRLVELDGWALATLLRLTHAEAGAEPADRVRRHLGVVGVDHSLNRLVVEEPGGPGSVDRDLEELDLSALDDEDLIAAARYVPETLPGYMLG